MYPVYENPPDGCPPRVRENVTKILASLVWEAVSTLVYRREISITEDKVEDVWIVEHLEYRTFERIAFGKWFIVFLVTAISLLLSRFIETQSFFLW